jgi:SmpA / OmlA family
MRKELLVCVAAVTLFAGCRSGTDQKSATPAPAPAPAPQAAAPAAKAPASTALYLCCNIRTETDWLSDGGYLVGRIIPAGTPVKHLGTSRSVASIEIDGKRYRLSNEFGVRAEPTEEWLKKVLVTQDPNAKLRTYPAGVQNAIKAGKLTRGMTKDQVVMSLGIPPAHTNGSLDASEWTYMSNRWVRYTVMFDQNGRLRDVTGGWRDTLLLP